MKKLAVPFLAIIISLCAVSSAFAANWVEVNRDDNFLISSDLSSLQYNNGKIRVWEKWIYRNESYIKEASNFLKKRPAYYLAYREYDVNNTTYRDLAATYYDKNGNVLYSIGESYKTTTIPPDTVADYLLNFYKALLGIR